MNETLQKSIAKILYNLLKRNFDDIESLTQIEKTQDFKLLKQLEGMLTETQEAENVDYGLMVATWNNLNIQVKDLNKKYENLITHIFEVFEAKPEDDFKISGTLYSHEKIISFKLSESCNLKYKNYIKALDAIICNFRLAMLDYETADLRDSFFDDFHIINEKNIKFRKVEISKKSIYLDTNTVQPILNDPKLKKYIESDKVAFVYSAYLVEDILNSNPIFLSSFFSDLLRLTKGGMVGYMDEGLCYVEERIEETTSRVKKYSQLTKTFEKTIINDFIRRYHYHPELRKGRELNKKISDDIYGFFKSDSKKIIPGFELVKNEFSDKNISDFIESGEIGEIEDVREAIENFSYLFDFINFETEALKLSNFNKIASSYRDNKHLEQAYICDYFVTEDQKMKSRAKIIYKTLNIKTKVLGINEFKARIKSNEL